MRRATPAVRSVVGCLALCAALRSPTGFVTGAIIDEKGAPIPDATIALQGGKQRVASARDGSFSFKNLPLGSQVIDVNAVGYVPTSVVVTPLPRGSRVQDVVLARLPAGADADAWLASVGFTRRRTTDDGVFLTAADFTKLEARYVADLQPRLPLLVERPTSYGPLLAAGYRNVSTWIRYVVDGELGWWLTVRNFNTDLPISNIIGVEYYVYPHVPPEFAITTHQMTWPRSVVIVIWTKELGTGDPPALSRDR
jgi:hypothetical protein